MPELPEVETICRGIRPLVIKKQVVKVLVRCHKLRWPVPTEALNQNLGGHEFTHVLRRGKYLLLKSKHGHLIIHLGMSGTVQFLASATEPQKHDHVDIQFVDHSCLRYTDPRRFGAVLWSQDPPEEHPLLIKLGPEPLQKTFNAEYLFHTSRNKKVPLKNFLMNSHVVVGVGNIYATESLFLAGLHPARPAGQLLKSECQILVKSIQEILTKAIERGGTTLRDFRHEDGTLGYFQQELQVYGRKGEPCQQCGTSLLDQRLGGRASCFCPHCQK